MATADAKPLPGFATRLRHYLGVRLLEFGGLCLFAVAVAALLALVSWSPADPSFNNATDGSPGNWLGLPGAYGADVLIQTLGVAAAAFLLPLAVWGLRIAFHGPLRPVPLRVLAWLAGTLFAATAIAAVPVFGGWPLSAGFGGVVGANLLASAQSGLGTWVAPELATTITVALATILGVLLFSYAAFLRPSHLSAAGGLFGLLGARRAERQGEAEAVPQPARQAPVAAPEPAEPSLSGWAFWRRAPRSPEEAAETPAARPKPKKKSKAKAPAPEPIEPSLETARVERPQAKPRPSARAKREAQPTLPLGNEDGFQLPPLSLLSEAKRSSAAPHYSDEALEQNARLLETVLQDFGIRGEIVNVRPGPVVTLYELEPAPGIKSARVIGLAEDIARSMSAVSARVAVVPGRNAIGIELPNADHEMVVLRELLEAGDYEKASSKLALALGKGIGGEPVVADLARMPHLLIAGTTGSGKSVGINTMILSLLYKLPPERCKLIMVDPKMLELSVYDGIPHLLAPVVTEPKKAVVALKWVVKEMEDRYRRMSKLGVRNIEGFNQRVAEAEQSGETLSRTVQTGFDKETGEAIYEQEELAPEPMPFIVVVIDEMADLMMVAGKEIEGAVQRLAQMARAAGIHMITATQRPSVDVITGTIKANFPTRISFQVTSKIDSRTILGEQGAEQLLGQGDMLYMAGGGRVRRVHGPFVSDDEVEKVVAFLKAQGVPEYLEAVTAEPEEGEDPFAFGDEGGGSGDDLYDQAVAIVARDRRASTSYVQRRLQIGYNRAARLIEMMEEQGVVSPPNHAGKREVLLGEGGEHPHD